MKILAVPFDVLLFRDGRPFNAQEDHVAVSGFPPASTVIQGAVRTTYITQRGIAFEEYLAGKTNKAKVAYDEIGRPEDTQLPFSIIGPFVARTKSDRTELLFPWPGDLLDWSHSGDGSSKVLRPAKEYGVSSLPKGLNPLLGENRSVPVAGYLSEQGLQEYLTNKPISVENVVTETDIFNRDYRIGIGLNNNARVVSEGLLYAAHFIALKTGYALAFETGRSLLNDEGFLKLGGESRTAHYGLSDWQVPHEPAGIRSRVAKEGRFLLYTLTPTLFDNNKICSWTSDDWCSSGLPSNSSLVGFRPATGPVEIGGWDMKNNWPKPTLQAVPAGSVYFFEAQGGLAPEAVDALFKSRWFKPLPGKHASLSFGMTLIGEW